MKYFELEDMINQLTDAERKSEVRVLMSSAASDSVLVRDFKVGERSLVTDTETEVFLVL